MTQYALFDIVVPSLNMEMASATIESLQENATFPHNYIVVYNGDLPTGYIEPCNRGLKAGTCQFVCFVNDDVLVRSSGWDELLYEEQIKGQVCFGPWVEDEDNMRINGWFLCLNRDYIDRYGWAFDPRFVCWCGDIDLLKRLEQDGYEPSFVKGIQVEHVYSKTFQREEWQDFFNPAQVRDIQLYEQKWQTNPNADKVKRA